MFPQFTLSNFYIYKGELKDKGQLCNMYTPLQNLAAANTHILGDFTTSNLDFDLLHPVDIIVQDSYDGAVNLILNDGKNIPRLINTRFSVQDENTFKIPDHAGFKDTNIYEDDTFNVDTALKAIPIKIPKVTYEGLQQNAGNMKAGAYTFYFKLCDADGNETEVIAESGIVQCHIGNVCSQQKNGIRMGLQDENTSKAIKFTLTNINAGFDYVRVIYARQSSGQDQASSWVYRKILFDYPVDNQGRCEIMINGSATEIDATESDVTVDYADINSVVTQEVCTNLLLFGNISAAEHDWDEIKRFTWKIIPRQTTLDDIGTLNINYEENYSLGNSDNDQANFKHCYYNTKNVYYNLGYWPDEIYRFGIVYIFEDNSLSPVINLQGVNFDKVKDDPDSVAYLQTFFETNTLQSGDSGTEIVYPNWEYETDDGWFKKAKGTNAYGVIKFKQTDVVNWNQNWMEPRPVGIEFNLGYIGFKDFNNSALVDIESEDTYADSTTRVYWKDVLKKHKIKGYFFVRQKRIPTILGQGLVIGHSCKDFGSLPLIKNERGYYTFQPFSIKDKHILVEEPETKEIKVYPIKDKMIKDEPEGSNYYKLHRYNIDNNALLFPDAEMMEATYNQLFTSSEFTCYYSSTPCTFQSLNDVVNIQSYTNNYTDYKVLKLTNIPEDMKLLTNGADYFSTLAGNPDEPFKTADLMYPWKYTQPQILTASEYLVRGKWGPYVGTSIHDIPYGSIVTVKLDKYSNKENAWIEDFEQNMYSDALFSPISDRTPIDQWGAVNPHKITCARGDCYISMFTHRMFRNFIDTELPTNTTIIDPSCFGDNYAVRCTCTISTSATSNMAKEHEGWDLEKEKNYDKGTQIAVYLLTGNVLGALAFMWQALKDEKGPDDAEKKASNFVDTAENGPYANEIAQAYETYVKQDKKFNIFTPISCLASLIKDRLNEDTKRKLKPKEQEAQKGFSIKALFTPDDLWELHGLASINRADVNAVGLGQWITFPVLSNKNLAFRDVDFSNATEEASFNQKRGFYPYSGMNRHLPLRDSNVINQATGISLPARQYKVLPKVPYFKQEYFTRITNSLADSASSFTNEFKIILQNAYQDYTKIYGSITKLVASGTNLYVIFKHGIGILDIASGISNGIKSEKGATDYLPQLGVVSDKYGSIWKDSILKTPNGIYGLDSVAKTIWRVTGTECTIISDLIANKQSSMGKYLIDALDMSEFEFRPYIGHINIKTHYNAFKHDVIFTYYNDILYSLGNPSQDSTIKDYYVEIDGETPKAYYKDYNGDSFRLADCTPERLLPEWNKDTDSWQSFEDLINQHENAGEIVRWAKGTNWSLCYNEDLQCFQTFYDWIPLESENIGNVFFSFDKDAIDNIHINDSQYLLTAEQSKDVVCKRLEQHKNVEIDPTFTNNTYIYICDQVSIKSKTTTLNTIQLTSKDHPEILQIQGSSVSSSKPAYYIISFYARTIDNTLTSEVTGYSLQYSTDNGSTKNYNFTLAANGKWQFYYIMVKFNKIDKISLFINSNNSEPIYIAEAKIKPCSKDIYDKVEKANNDTTVMRVDKMVDGFYGLDTYDLRNSANQFYLWKHGQAGVYDNQGEIKPTVWYGNQHEFNFEFVVNDKPGQQKIFNNLQLISNKAPMLKIEYEIPGEGYDWYKYRSLIYWLNKAVEKEVFGTSCTLYNAYKNILSKDYDTLIKDPNYTDCPLDKILFIENKKTNLWFLPRLPFLPIVLADRKGLPEISHNYTKENFWQNQIDADPKRANFRNDYLWNTSDAVIVYDKQFNEYYIRTEQYCNNIAKWGRVRGNCQYLEDSWRVEIRPVPIRYVHYDVVNDKLVKEVLREARHRDKYIKVKIRYSGEDLAVIQAVSTLFDISKA